MVMSMIVIGGFRVSKRLLGRRNLAIGMKVALCLKMLPSLLETELAKKQINFVAKLLKWN